jgi:uncharacterized membrane protein
MTSGEIVVSLAPPFVGSVERAAAAAFRRIGLHRMRERNGVLIFLVPSRRQFAIRGDVGIHDKVGQSFWEDQAQVLGAAFRAGDHTGGLLCVIAAIAEELARHFPPRDDDRNEVTDLDFGR